MATLDQLQTKIKQLQNRADAMIAKRAQKVVDQIRQLMLEHGLTTADIEAQAKARREGKRVGRPPATAPAPAKKSKMATGKLPPKYRDPKTGATWSGKARPPQWIAGVRDRTKFLIDKSEASAAAPASLGGMASRPATAKKAAAKGTSAKKATAVKSPTRKAAVKKGAARKTVATKSASNTVAAKKAASKKTAGKRMSASGGAVSATAAPKTGMPARKGRPPKTLLASTESADVKTMNGAGVASLASPAASE